MAELTKVDLYYTYGGEQPKRCHEIGVLVPGEIYVLIPDNIDLLVLDEIDLLIELLPSWLGESETGEYVMSVKSREDYGKLEWIKRERESYWTDSGIDRLSISLGVRLPELNDDQLRWLRVNRTVSNFCFEIDKLRGELGCETYPEIESVLDHLERGELIEHLEEVVRPPASKTLPARLSSQFTHYAGTPPRPASAETKQEADSSTKQSRAVFSADTAGVQAGEQMHQSPRMSASPEAVQQPDNSPGQASSGDTPEDQPEALTESQRATLHAMAEFDPMISLAAAKLRDHMATMDSTAHLAAMPSLSEETIRKCVNRLIELGCAERPNGSRSGARLTTRGRMLVGKIAD